MRGAPNGRPKPCPTRAKLGPREQEILALVADGKSNKEIATALLLAENTVKRYVKSILEKLHLENRVQAAVFAVREDLVSPSSGMEAGEPLP